MNKYNDSQIDEYIQQIDRFWPFPLEKKESALENLKQDVRDAMCDKNSINPTETFGDPYVVAKDISFSQGWAENRASYFLRTIAYLLDMLFILDLIILSIGCEFVLFEYIFIVEGTPLKIIFLILGFLIQNIFMFLMLFSYFIVSEGLFSTTLGKKVLGLITCDESGVRLVWKQAAIRNIAKIAPLFLLCELLIGWLKQTNKQRALDLVAKTIVVKI